jgi:hypothetical protein
MRDAKLSKQDPRNRPPVRKLILLEKVEIDRSTQARVKLDPQHVERLHDEVLAQDKDFKEPIEVYDDGWKYWLADGFHRVKAYQKAGREKVSALVREGTHRDAMIHAAGANAEHGLPRTTKDKRRAVQLLLKDDEIAKLSNRTIASLARCSANTVGTIKEEMGLDSNTVTYTDKHGNVTEMDTSGQKGRKSKKANVTTTPGECLTLAHGAVYEACNLARQAKSAAEAERVLAAVGKMKAEAEAVLLELGGTVAGAARARWRAHLSEVANLAKAVGSREDLADLATALLRLAGQLKELGGTLPPSRESPAPAADEEE